MWIAVLFSRTKTASPKTQLNVNCCFQGETLRAATDQAERTATSYRLSSPNYEWCVLAGELTHQVVPPEEKYDIQPITNELK